MTNTKVKSKCKQKYAVPMKAVYLLRKVQKAILEEPKRINMKFWGRKYGKDIVAVREGSASYQHYIPPCGTIGCIAGWGAVLGTKSAMKMNTKEFAEFIYTADDRMIRLSKLSYEQANRLFYNDNWPARFENKLRRYNTGTPQYAKVVSDRIEHFILTGE